MGKGELSAEGIGTYQPRSRTYHQAEFDPASRARKPSHLRTEPLFGWLAWHPLEGEKQSLTLALSLRPEEGQLSGSHLGVQLDSQSAMCVDGPSLLPKSEGRGPG